MRSAAPQPRETVRIDARMVKGLPGSEEAVAWLRETLAAMQKLDPRPDIDLGGVHDRLAALEARPIAAASPELATLARVLEEINARLAALEGRPHYEPADLSEILARLAALEAREFSTTIVRDPLDPLSWEDVDSAKAALAVMVTREAARRCGHEVTLYEDMIRLDMLGDRRSFDEEFLFAQHAGWAQERQLVELARVTHNQAIRALTSLEQAVRYDWRSGWPDIA